MIVLTFTEQEAAVLRQLIDAAVRGQGLRVAEVALVLDTKIAKAIEAAKPSGNSHPNADSGHAGIASAA